MAKCLDPMSKTARNLNPLTQPLGSMSDSVKRAGTSFTTNTLSSITTNVLFIVGWDCLIILLEGDPLFLKHFRHRAPSPLHLCLRSSSKGSNLV